MRSLSRLLKQIYPATPIAGQSPSQYGWRDAPPRFLPLLFAARTGQGCGTSGPDRDPLQADACPAEHENR
jgi:hypothetical protein